MKKKKMDLKKLKVESFITNVEMKQMKGGKKLEDVQDGKAIGGTSGLPWDIRVHA